MPVRLGEAKGMRKPTFGKPPKRPSAPKAPKPEDQPVPRRLDLEAELCRAIKDKRQVELWFEDDRLPRLYDPYGVFTSTKNKVLVTGTQVRDGNDPVKPSEPRFFEVGNIRSLRITDSHFAVDRRFDRFDARYTNGFICVIDVL